ncbi:hypothetical protein PVAND_015440 [Polypedilum vanderplanki]|uniref:Uncharacterized protein n=1 Tax=Polypedilum vanderplanki TaxID=319348 RepID=A0A9J6BC88_POLVA|nr:hypothetical protein PVAND_015440 [Polypedilum vanderplanki]
MGPKLICIIFTSITIFSVVTYIVYRDRIINKLVPKLCNENESCVRFCCHNKVCDNDEKLRKREIKYSKNLDKNFKIIKGFPCEIVHTHKEWSFLKNGILVDKSNNTYDWTQYCYTFKNGPLTCPPIYETENVKDVYPWCKSLTPIRDRSETFVKYFLYAFCIPAIISSIIILLNEFNFIPDDYKTGIGKYSCTISDPINDYSKEAKERISRAQKIYLYGPISFFLLMNLGFYLTTAYKIFKARRNAENFSTSTISRHTRKQKGR